jgi:signal transduction histidine kinase
VDATPALLRVVRALASGEGGLEGALTETAAALCACSGRLLVGGPHELHLSPLWSGLGEIPELGPEDRRCAIEAWASGQPATRGAGLALPLRGHGRTVALLWLGLSGAAPDAALAGELGGLLGPAVEAVRLEAWNRRYLVQMQALWEIDRAIIDDRDLAEVLGLVVRHAASLVVGDAALALIEREREVRIAASHGPAAARALGEPVSLSSPVARLFFVAGPMALLLPGQPGRALVAPLRLGERSLGGLVVVRPDGEWGDDDLTILATLGQRAAVAVGRARAREAEKRRSEQLALVASAAEIAASTLEADRLLDSIARFIQRSFGYYGVDAYVVDKEARQVFLAGAAGAALAIARGSRIRFGHGIIGWVAERGQYVLANDVRHEPRFVPSAMGATRAELAVPVRVRGEVVAVINVESDRALAFDEGDVMALDGIASQVASAIENARLFDENVRALRNLEILQEITNDLNGDLDLDALLAKIAQRSVDAVRPAQMGAVLLYADGFLSVRSSHGYARPEALGPARLAFHEGLAGGVFVSGQGRLVRSSAQDHGSATPAFREAAGDALAKSALCVPINLPHQKLGVLLLESVTSPEAFGADDLRFTQTLASQAAIAIGNALQLRRIVELDRHRRDYLSNVSHELRTPLTVVQGYLEGILEGLHPGDPLPVLRIAHEQSQRLGRMIDEVLEVSRLEQGIAQRHLEWSLVDLGALVRRVLQVLLQDSLGKGLTVVPQLPPELCVEGDQRLLQLLVTNLVENAVKFTPRGGRLDVEAEAQGEEAVLRVHDTGIGIAVEHQERIFEKFFTVDSGTTRSHGGAGIGLYLAREVVAVHAGSIRVQSRQRAGTTFEVRLPRKRRD